MHLPRFSITSFLGVAAFGCLSCLVALAAPILPVGVRLSDEIRSTAGIDRLHLVIMPLPKPLKEEGFVRHDVHEQWREHLAEAGIKLAPSDEAPTLRLVVTMFTDVTVPGAFGYLNILTLEQNVQVENKEGQLRVPTWTGLHMGMKTKEHLTDGFQATLDESISHFLVRVASANRQAE